MCISASHFISNAQESIISFFMSELCSYTLPMVLLIEKLLSRRYLQEYYAGDGTCALSCAILEISRDDVTSII